MKNVIKRSTGIHSIHSLGVISTLTAAVALALAQTANADPLVVNAFQTLTLTPGTHHYDSLTVLTGGTLRLSGDTTLVVSGDVNIQGATASGGEATPLPGEIDGTIVDYGTSSYDGTTGANGADASLVGGPGVDGSSGGDGYGPFGNRRGYNLNINADGNIDIGGNIDLSVTFPTGTGGDGGNGGSGADGVNATDFGVPGLIGSGKGGPGGDGGRGGNGGRGGDAPSSVGGTLNLAAGGSINLLSSFTGFGTPPPPAGSIVNVGSLVVDNNSAGGLGGTGGNGSDAGDGGFPDPNGTNPQYGPGGTGGAGGNGGRGGDSYGAGGHVNLQASTISMGALTQVSAQGGSGGDGGQGGNGGYGGDGVITNNSTCSTSPGCGGAGGNSGNGGNGAHGGAITYWATSFTNNGIISVNGGGAGPAGYAGTGGIGGSDKNYYSSNGQPAPNGADGVRGTPGQAGANGTITAENLTNIGFIPSLGLASFRQSGQDGTAAMVKTATGSSAVQMTTTTAPFSLDQLIQLSSDPNHQYQLGYKWLNLSPDGSLELSLNNVTLFSITHGGSVTSPLGLDFSVTTESSDSSFDLLSFNLPSLSNLPTSLSQALAGSDIGNLAMTLNPGSPVGVQLNVIGAPVSTVPLPASLWLYLSGMIGLVLVGRRKHSN